MNNILIIGATSDIASEVCFKLANDKKNLIITGRNENQLNKLKSKIEENYKVKVYSIVLDVLKQTDIERFKKDIKEIGYEGAVLAYGYLGEQDKAQSDKEETDRILKINYNSAVEILEECANYLESKNKGYICAISSVAGDRGRQSNYLYGSAKGALSIYLQGLRNRLSKSSVHVLTVKPGFVKTKMTVGRVKEGKLVATPERVANDIYKAIIKKKNVIYTPYFWKFILLVIKSIPETIFKKLKL